MTTTTPERPTGVLAPVADPMFSIGERQALAGFLAGYNGLTRDAYTLDLRQYTAWCTLHGLHLFQAKRVDIESSRGDMEAAGRARATVGRRLCTVAEFYRYAEEEELLTHSPAAHVRRPRLDYESHATALRAGPPGAAPDTALHRRYAWLRPVGRAAHIDLSGARDRAPELSVQVDSLCPGPSADCGGRAMVRQVISIRWADDVSAEAKQQYRQALDALRCIPELLGLTWGDDAGHLDGNFDFVAVMDFADFASARVYVEHPLHQIYSRTTRARSWAIGSSCSMTGPLLTRSMRAGIVVLIERPLMPPTMHSLPVDRRG